MSDTSARTTQPEVSLRFNGQAVTLAPEMSLADLLTAQAIASDAVATAVNGVFVPREQRSSTPMQGGDEVLTFQAIVGG